MGPRSRCQFVRQRFYDLGRRFYSLERHCYDIEHYYYEFFREHSFIKFDDQITVKSITLDKFCEDKNIKLIDFIWADVQGAEENLILGGLKTLNTKVRYLYTEYSNKEYYEGQLKLENLLKLIGDNWEVIKDFGYDVLLKNKTL